MLGALVLVDAPESEEDEDVEAEVLAGDVEDVEPRLSLR